MNKRKSSQFSFFCISDSEAIKVSSRMSRSARKVETFSSFWFHSTPAAMINSFKKSFQISFQYLSFERKTCRNFFYFFFTFNFTNQKKSSFPKIISVKILLMKFIVIEFFSKFWEFRFPPPQCSTFPDKKRKFQQILWLHWRINLLFPIFDFVYISIVFPREKYSYSFMSIDEMIWLKLTASNTEKIFWGLISFFVLMIISVLLGERRKSRKLYDFACNKF